jgi:hypothetical protein
VSVLSVHSGDGLPDGVADVAAGRDDAVETAGEVDEPLAFSR